VYVDLGVYYKNLDLATGENSLKKIQSFQVSQENFVFLG
jgi:hypothetical protein